MRKLNVRLTAAAAGLLTDDALLARFRHHPASALRGYRLTDEQIDALKAGDFGMLTSHGLDATALYAPATGWRRAAASIARKVPRLVPVMLAAGLWASPVAIASPVGGRRARRIFRVRARAGRSGPSVRARAGGRTFRYGRPSDRVARARIRADRTCSSRIACIARTQFGGGVDGSSVAKGTRVRVNGFIRAGIRAATATPTPPPVPTPVHPVASGRTTIRARAAGQRVERTVSIPGQIKVPAIERLPIDLRTGRPL